MLQMSDHGPPRRALCRIKLLPVTHVLVDTWILIVKPVYKLLNVSDDLKWTTNTHVTPFSLTFKAYLTISMVLDEFLFVFLLLQFFTHIFTRPYSFLPILMMGGGSLHKAMPPSCSVVGCY